MAHRSPDPGQHFLNPAQLYLHYRIPLFLSWAANTASTRHGGWTISAIIMKRFGLYKNCPHRRNTDGRSRHCKCRYEGGLYPNAHCTQNDHSAGDLQGSGSTRERADWLFRLGLSRSRLQEMVLWTSSHGYAGE